MMKQKEDFFGYCCKNQSKFRVLYNGNPRRNYVVFVCEIHYKTHPFNQNILKVEAVNKIV